jgi:hypothetical protein
MKSGNEASAGAKKTALTSNSAQQFFLGKMGKYAVNHLAAALGLHYEIGDAANRKKLVVAGARAPARRLGAD